MLIIRRILALSVLSLSSCVTVAIPHIDQNHPAYPEAPAAALAPTSHALTIEPEASPSGENNESEHSMRHGSMHMNHACGGSHGM
jgi:hypothetical protein